MSLLVIVTGHSGTGKTSFSRRLAAELNLLCLNKDDIKERLADELGVADREESQKVGRATYAILDFLIEEHLKIGQSFIVESNFGAGFYTPKVRAWSKKYSCTVLQVLLKADPEVLLERVKNRIDTGERHPAHMETSDITSGKFRTLLSDGRIQPIQAGELIELDTTNFSEIDASLKEVVARCKLLLSAI